MFRYFNELIEINTIHVFKNKKNATKNFTIFKLRKRTRYRRKSRNIILYCHAYRTSLR